MLHYRLYCLLLLPCLFGTFHETTAGKALAKESIQGVVQVRTHIGQAVILIGIALYERGFNKKKLYWTCSTYNLLEEDVVSL